jgi:hypothetical protein
MILEQVLDRGALKAEKEQTPATTELTVWEQQVMNNPNLYRHPQTDWDRRTRGLFIARWGGLPKQEQPVAASTARAELNSRR